MIITKDQRFGVPMIDKPTSPMIACQYSDFMKICKSLIKNINLQYSSSNLISQQLQIISANRLLYMYVYFRKVKSLQLLGNFCQHKSQILQKLNFSASFVYNLLNRGDFNLNVIHMVIMVVFLFGCTRRFLIKLNIRKY